MQWNEKSCPDGSASEQQMELEGFNETTTSANNFNTQYGPISRFLSNGQENAVSLRQLEALTGHDGRTVRLMIQRERLAGKQILSDNYGGYFLPASEQELKQFVKSMKGRAMEILRTAEAVAAGDREG